MSLIKCWENSFRDSVNAETISFHPLSARARARARYPGRERQHPAGDGAAPVTSTLRPDPRISRLNEVLKFASPNCSRQCPFEIPPLTSAEFHRSIFPVPIRETRIFLRIPRRHSILYSLKFGITSIGHRISSLLRNSIR